MEYRLATTLDSFQLADCRWAYWLEDGVDPAAQDQDTFFEDFEKWLTARMNVTWFVWCAIENGTVVSHVYIQRIEKLPKPSAPVDQFGYVTNVYTRPGYRSKGIGTVLVNHVKAWALETDLEFLVLWPSEDSIPFWKRSDFASTDALSSEIRPYIN